MLRLLPFHRLSPSAKCPRSRSRMRRLSLPASEGIGWKHCSPSHSVWGLRQSETLGLRWDDADLEDGSLRAQRTLQRVDRAYTFFGPKTARSRRTIPIPPPVVRALRDHRTRQLAERLRAGTAWGGKEWGELVFCDEAGEPLAGIRVTRLFKSLLAAADLAPMRYHDLRHGAAILMAAQGVPARVVMEVLGHSQISTTMEVYSQITEEAQRQAVDRVADALWGSK